MRELSLKELKIFLNIQAICLLSGCALLFFTGLHDDLTNENPFIWIVMSILGFMFSIHLVIQRLQSRRIFELGVGLYGLFTLAMLSVFIF